MQGQSVTARERRVISGWGRTSRLNADVATPESTDSVAELITGSPAIVARGLGRAYGDAAQVSAGTVVDMTRLDRIRSFDPATGIVDVEAGVSLDHLMRVFVPQGWFVPVTPGTRFVTIGGAIASDIHGKNHHKVGSFGQHVTSLDIVTGDGVARTVSPQPGGLAELFWATVGGMGLTGIVTGARVRLQAIESAKIMSTTMRVRNLDHLMETMLRVDTQTSYSVAWVDCLAKGGSFGRGLLTYGDHATAAEVGSRKSRWEFGGGILPDVPMDFPSWSLNRLSVRAFNELWFRKMPKIAKPHLESIPAFFHPLDAVGDWNRVYGPGGFIQYQFVVPDGRADVVSAAIEALGAIGAPSFLAVLKRFGPGNEAPLSFPQAGWTLALDIPARLDGLGRTLDRLDAEVAEAGGRIYLSKDSRLRPELLDAMYPRLREWQDVRAGFDPDSRFGSDLSARLGM